MGLSRVRGLVLERLGEERAVLLTSDGQFVRVRLRGGASLGDEAWGEPDVRMWEGLRAALGGWQRAAAVTALAFGAAGALFAAVYLRGWAPLAPGAVSPGTMVEGAVADASRAPAAPATVQATGPSAPAIHIVESREAPRLSVSVEWQRWPTLTLRRPEGEESLGLAEPLRRALLGAGAGETAAGASSAGSIPAGVSGPGRPATVDGSSGARGAGAAAGASAVTVGVAGAAAPRPALDPARAGRTDSLPLLRLRAEF